MLWRRLLFYGLLSGALLHGLWCYFLLQHSHLPDHAMISASIVGLPKHQAHHTRLLVVTDTINHQPAHYFLLLNWYGHVPQLYLTDHAIFSVRLKNLDTIPAANRQFLYWLLAKNINAVGYIRYRLTHTSQPISLSQQLLRLRYYLSTRLLRLGQSLVMIRIIPALTVGDQTHLTIDDWQLLRETGTSHLLAISGLHIGLLASLGYGFILLVWRYGGAWRFLPQQLSALSCGLLCALIYSALAGFAVPTERSLIMLSLLAVSKTFYINMKSSSILLYTALCILSQQPLAIFSASFWLTFMAVALLIYSSGARLHKLPFWKTLGRTQSYVTLGLLPLGLFFFAQTSIIGVIANFIAIPVVSWLVVPASLLAIASLPFSHSVTHLLLTFADICLRGLWWWLSWLAKQPLATLTRADFSLAQTVALLFAIGWALLPRGMPGRWLGGVLAAYLLYTPLAR